MLFFYMSDNKNVCAISLQTYKRITSYSLIIVSGSKLSRIIIFHKLVKKFVQSEQSLVLSHKQFNINSIFYRYLMPL